MAGRGFRQRPGSSWSSGCATSPRHPRLVVRASGLGFEGYVVCRRFAGVALFGRTTFTGVARFDRMMFAGAAWFDKASFTDVAWFAEATFTGEQYSLK